MDEMIELGDRVKDRVTGFEGLAVSRVRYLNGCIQFCVEPGVDKEGKPQKYEYIDEGQLYILTKAACTLPQMTADPPGGVMSNTPGKQFDR